MTELIVDFDLGFNGTSKGTCAVVRTAGGRETRKVADPNNRDKAEPMANAAFWIDFRRPLASYGLWQEPCFVVLIPSSGEPIIRAGIVDSVAGFGQEVASYLVALGDSSVL